MLEPDWKTKYLMGAVRHHTTAHFLRCRALIDRGNLDGAALCLARGAWQNGLDLTGVPPELVRRTHRLCWRARGMVEHGHTEALSAVVEQIIADWT